VDVTGAASRRVVVVGGGITGLTAAYRLAEAAAKDAKLHVDLIESGDRLGGKILTDRVGGFLVEGGPDTWLARKPEAAALCKELGLEGRLIPTNPATRGAFVSRRGKLHRLPEGMSGLVPSRIGPLFTSGMLSPLGRLRAAWEPFVGRSDVDAEESVASFIRRRLGREAYDYLVEPLLCGIYGGDGEHLSLDATAPALKDMEAEHGSILRGLRLARRAEANEPAKHPTPFISLAGGVQELVDALVRRLEGCVTIQTYTDVASVRRTDHALTLEVSTGETVTADAIVIATPAYAAAHLTESLNPELSRALGDIPFISNAAVSLGFREADAPGSRDGYGYVVPRREGRLALACSWATSKLPGRAPDGCILARVFLGRAGQEIDDATADHDLVDLALEELRTTLGVSARPIFSRVYRYPRSMPQYTLGHVERVHRIEGLAADTPGVFLAGNAYHGVGISDCIRSGQKAALAALRRLEGTGT
jgi:oxygen-dependent protoporphyrinogen oxidase